jgi:hypothetical protein
MWILNITVNIKDYFPSISKPNLMSASGKLAYQVQNIAGRREGSNKTK